MRCKKNIILNLQNITPHFTGKEKILSSRFRNITSASIIIMLSFTNMTLCSSNIFNNSNVSALDYSSNVGIGFTFNPTLSINISSSDLIIDNLTPGTNNDSNVINVSVATNASHGYTLSATVGDSLHNNSDLVHTNSTNVFSSITTDSNLPNLTTDNTWGYSYRLSNNSNNSNNSDSSNSNTGNSSDSNTWSNYSGLSNETSKTLVNTDSQITKPIDFKIAAKASSAQPSGTYTNTINFIAISKPIPKTIEDIAYMQTFGELLPTDLQSVKDSMVLNQDYILKDSRDEKEYYVTRLEDGNVWMTQNLDLDLDPTNPLTSDSTDLIDDSLSGAYVDGYSYDVDTGIITWAPERKTISFQNITATGWINSSSEPYSANKTDSIKTGHASLGNHYNWTAAIASNNSSSLKRDTLSDISKNPKNSICPKGWRLPTVSNEDANMPGSTNEFARLNFIYNNDQINTDAGLINAPIYLVRGGNISISNEGTLTMGYGFYWYSTAKDSVDAYFLRFQANSVSIANYGINRKQGVSVRCLAR